MASAITDLSWADQLPWLVLESALKATLLLSLALSLVILLRHASSATRHAFWTVALFSVVLLPLCAVCLPEIRWLPSWLDFSVAAGLWRASSSTATANWQLGLLLVWTAGATFILLRLVLAQLSLWRLGRYGAEPAPTAIQQYVAELAERRGMSICPRVLISSQRKAPMTWGIWNSKLLLPESALDWPQSRLEAAVLHELAHIHRRDCLSQTLSQLALAMFWFHPLVWYANYRIRIEREQACDDWVLDRIAPCDYAEQLLSIAAGNAGRMLPSCAAMNMTQPSLLERRVRSILNSHANRRAPRRSSLFVAGLASLLLVATLGMLQGRAILWPAMTQAIGDSELSLESIAIARLRDMGGKFQFATHVQAPVIPPDERATKDHPTALQLAGRHISDRELRWLRYLPSLTTVHLSDTKVSDDGLQCLASLRNLEVLGLDRTAITDRGLAQLKGFSRLRSLHLSSTSVTSAGLSNLTQLERLTDLSLNQTAVGDAGVQHLLSLRNLKSLQVFGTRVTSGAITTLKEGLQNLTVLWDSTRLHGAS